jgi:hypothetical protein
MTALARASSNCKRQTHHLVREDVTEGLWPPVFSWKILLLVSLILWCWYCSGLKVITAEETEQQEGRRRRSDIANTAYGRKERWHTVRLFATNSLKEGAVWRIYATQELYHRNTLRRLRNSRRSGVFSVPCRAEPNRAVNESLIASNRLASLLPGNSYKHLDDARVGKGHVTASAVTSRVCSDAKIKGFSRMSDPSVCRSSQ